MKTIVIILLSAFFIGCSADSSPNHASNKESDMFSKGNKENYVIFSPLEGVLLQNGNPLPNAKIIRRLRWNGNDDGLVEEFVTDDKGRFSLPIHEEQLSLGLTQFVSSTKLETEVKGQLYDVWYNNKFEPHLYAETDGKVEDLVCDLSAEEIVVSGDLSKIMTVCRWKNMPESEF